MSFVYDPETQLPGLFPSEASLAHIDDVLAHIARFKAAASARLQQKLQQYNPHIDAASSVEDLARSLAQVRADAQKIHSSISEATSQIQKLDTAKTNLVLSMKVLKRLQMLVSAYDALAEVAQTRDYEKIAAYLGAVRGLMGYFKSYRSIDEIAALNQRIHHTQNKLVDDVFLDFEDAFTNHFTNDKLKYGCEILEMADPKNKDRLLTWFYGLQLKEIQAIFSAAGEAGSLENLSRRYLFFHNNILAHLRSNCMHAFPAEWGVDVELSQLFCKMTQQEIAHKLAARPVPAAVILDALSATLAFEKSLGETFGTSAFSRMVSASFEPHLVTWVHDQDAQLGAKFMELHSRGKVPPEIAEAASPEDLIHTLQVNSVPNFAESSSDLFRMFHKSWGQASKLSAGPVLLDLARVFAKYLQQYHHTVLQPVLQAAADHPQGIEPIKYLTMLFNTADYVIKNTSDMQDRLVTAIEAPHKDAVTFDAETALFFDLIGRAIRALVRKVNSDLGFSWRQFENSSWASLEAASEPSRYMDGMVASLTTNHRMICPLIIREGYVRNYADRLVETVVGEFMERLGQIKPLPVNAAEQILLDVASLKAFFHKLPHFSDPNYDASKPPSEADPQVPRAYLRHLHLHFGKLESVLRLLLTPSLPVDNIVESYLSIVGDRSVNNFEKVLGLKGIAPRDQPKYTENFKLQVLSRANLVDESPILAGHFEPRSEAPHPSSQPAPPQVDYRELVSSKSPEPTLPDFLKTNSAKIQALKLNNPLKDFALNGEGHVNKLNENFKNLGKFFKMDNEHAANER